MKYIKEYVDSISDELEGAKDYIEKALYFKAQGNMPYYKNYSEMAQQELNHAQMLHSMVVEEIEKIKTTYKPTEDMRKIWEESHNYYVEQVAWIKQMLAM